MSYLYLNQEKKISRKANHEFAAVKNLLEHVLYSVNHIFIDLDIEDNLF